MKDSYIESTILSNEEIYPNIYKLKIKGKFSGKPGQFFMLRGWNSLDPFLPRPISIHSKTDDDITFLYEKKGKGTHLIGSLKKGDKLSLMGPLGNGFNIEEINKNGKIALVAGGIGIAPLLYLGENIDRDIDLYAGFRDESFSIEEFNKYVDNIYISTESGKEGYKGFITGILKDDYDLVITCGPEVMIKEVAKIIDDERLIISMESRMACGIGACMGCAIKTIDGVKRVCKEGPVFVAKEVIFND